MGEVAQELVRVLNVPNPRAGVEVVRRRRPLFPPTREQLWELLGTALSLHGTGHQLLWLGLLADVLYSRWAEFGPPWKVSEEVAYEFLVAELRKAAGVASHGAEFFFQEEAPGKPRIVRFLEDRGVESWCGTPRSNTVSCSGISLHIVTCGFALRRWFADR